MARRELTFHFTGKLPSRSVRYRVRTWFGRLLCSRGYHRWNLTFRRVGEPQRCERPSCNAVAYAERPGLDGWRVEN
jgi:hypothetical protein